MTVMTPEFLVNAILIAAVVGVMLGPDWLVKLIAVGLIANVLLVFELIRVGAYDMVVRIIGGYLVMIPAMAFRAGTDLIRTYHASDDDDGGNADGDNGRERRQNVANGGNQGAYAAEHQRAAAPDGNRAFPDLEPVPFPIPNPELLRAVAGDRDAMFGREGVPDGFAGLLSAIYRWIRQRQPNDEPPAGNVVWPPEDDDAFAADIDLEGIEDFHRRNDRPPNHD